MSSQETSDYDARVQSIKASGTGEDRPHFVDVGHILRRFGCQICGRTLLDPVQTACGQRVCRKCIYDTFGENQQSIPGPFKHDGEDAMDTDDLECKNGLEKQDIHNDPATRRQTQMEWRKLEEHVASCHFIPVPCPNAAKGCQQQLAAMNMEQHKSACGYTNATCQHCAVHYLRKDEVNYGTSCQFIPLPCPNAAKVWLQLAAMSMEQPQHYMKSMAFRMMELMLTCSKDEIDGIFMQKVLLPLVLKFFKTEKGAGATKGSAARIEEKYKKKLRQLEMTLASVLSSMDELKTHLENRTAGGGSGDLGDPDLANNIERMKRRFDVLERRLKEYDAESIPQRLAELEDSLRQLPVIIPGAGSQGVHTWMIYDYARKKQDAVEGRKDYFCSQPFCLGGYKMCLKIYPNSRDDGEGKYISVQFAFMRGDNDDLLEWSVAWKVTFTILFPGNPMRNISRTFVGDDRHPAFEKPNTEMNRMCGSHFAFSQDEVEDCLVNDILLLRFTLKRASEIGYDDPSNDETTEGETTEGETTEGETTEGETTEGETTEGETTEGETTEGGAI